MSSDWNNALGETIGALGSPDFPGRLVAALRGRIDFDYSVMFAYCGDARPIDLFDDFPLPKRRVFVTDYQEGPYLLDPFFLACKRPVGAGLYRLRDLVPDRFYQSEYFRSYYVQTGLSEEIGYFVGLPGEVTAVISLMRTDRLPVFSAREFRTLKDFEPIVLSLARNHWVSVSRRFRDEEPKAENPGIQQHIEHAFLTFGKSVLTKRERSVVEYVLKGYSSEAIGTVLGISPGTVRIHRKNIYSKLGINSQGALFSRFIDALTSERSVS